ncbi:uncharacterized protein DNG_09753 [Cephalotrichum gorgonifer]|uniref:DUF6923 domain-containing protein n=1 Tax=Cephalotrichum gorgonifer TaxID=2041049 RepID=A0AAE8N7E0_9PEZI|nr:uncharacterized protein DNG_09753 [Cephalotrichum gorgonifer]
MVSFWNLLLLATAPAALGAPLLDLIPNLCDLLHILPLPIPECPPPPCDKHGWLIQGAALIRVDIGARNYQTVATSVGGGTAINGIGYNRLDNFLYGCQGTNNQIIRIGLDGSSSIIGTIGGSVTNNIGDIDHEGFYWAATQNAATWIKVDLRPGSSTYGQVVDSGTTPAPGRGISDWVHFPIAGNYLWAVGSNPAGGSSLLRWGFNTHSWEILADYPDTDSDFGGEYGSINGTLWASSNGSGRIWAFSIFDLTAPYVASQGPASSSNDGARCVSNIFV